MVAEFELNLLGESIKKCILSFRGKFCKVKVPFRLPFAPYALEGTGIEYGEGHEVVGLKGLLRPIEISLAIRDLRVFLSFLKHLAGLQTGNADFLFYAGNDVDETFSHKLIACGGNGKDFFKYLTVIVGVVYFDCHWCSCI